MSDKIKYLLIAILSFGFGFAWYNKKKLNTVDDTFNKTIAVQKGDKHFDTSALLSDHCAQCKYFLVFNSVVVLSRQISKEQYDSFLSQYPTGKAPSNVLDQFSTPTDKYVVDNGKYYEYKWDGVKYSVPIEITKEEYIFLTNKSSVKVYSV